MTSIDHEWYSAALILIIHWIYLHVSNTCFKITVPLHPTVAWKWSHLVIKPPIVARPCLTAIHLCNVPVMYKEYLSIFYYMFRIVVAVRHANRPFIFVAWWSHSSLYYVSLFSLLSHERNNFRVIMKLILKLKLSLKLVIRFFLLSLRGHHGDTRGPTKSWMVSTESWIESTPTRYTSSWDEGTQPQPKSKGQTWAEPVTSAEKKSQPSWDWLEPSGRARPWASEDVGDKASARAQETFGRRATGITSTREWAARQRVAMMPLIVMISFETRRAV